MMHRIIEVKALKNFVVSVVFQNGTVKEYDVEKLFDILPQFLIFKKENTLFECVKVDVGGYGISWNDELDLSAEEIWEEGILIEEVYEIGISDRVGYQVSEARRSVGMTQKELSQKTGIYQADISKIERGLSNPSLQTLEKIANGLGMKLRIEFTK